jgi:hypothetical protein
VRWEWKVVSKVEGKEAGRVALSIQNTCLEESCFVTSPGPVTRYQGRKGWKKVFQTFAQLLGTNHPAAPETTALPDIHHLGIDHVRASHDGGGHWGSTTGTSCRLQTWSQWPVGSGHLVVHGPGSTGLV